jgi:GntR family transcriptional regulator
MVAAKRTICQDVIDALRERIRDGEFAQGKQFLTERQLAADFGVSRPTANKILTSLVSEGILQIRKGIGTFVNAGVLDYDLRRLVSFTDKARAAGRKPATRVLKFERLPVSRIHAEITSRLALQANEEAYYFERLRLADGTPVIFERRYVPARLCPDLTARALAGSLYSLWTQRYGLTVGGAEQSIQAINLSAEDAKVLRVPARTAALRVCAVGFLESRQPLWFEQTTYRGDAYEFQTMLGGFSSSRPAVGRFAEVRARAETGGPR